MHCRFLRQGFPGTTLTGSHAQWPARTPKKLPLHVPAAHSELKRQLDWQSGGVTPHSGGRNTFPVQRPRRHCPEEHSMSPPHALPQSMALLPRHDSAAERRIPVCFLNASRMCWPSVSAGECPDPDPDPDPPARVKRGESSPSLAKALRTSSLCAPPKRSFTMAFTFSPMPEGGSPVPSNFCMSSLPSGVLASRQ